MNYMVIEFIMICPHFQKNQHFLKQLLGIKSNSYRIQYYHITKKRYGERGLFLFVLIILSNYTNIAFFEIRNNMRSEYG